MPWDPSSDTGEIATEDFFVDEEEKPYRLKAGIASKEGLGKCVAAGTKIETPNGTRAIEEIQPGDVVLGAFGPAKVARTSESKQRTVTVKFSNQGSNYPREISGTPEHPIFTTAGWKSIKSLQKLHYGEKTYQKTKEIPDEVPLFPPFREQNNKSRLLGYLVGDGNFKTSGSPGFTNQNPDVLKDVTKILDQEFDARLSNSPRADDNYLVIGNDGIVKHWLMDLGLWGLTSQEKFIPKKFRNIDFVFGLWQTDGWSTETDAELTLSSEELVNQVSRILSTHDIRHTKAITTKGDHRIDIGGRFDVGDFRRKIFGGSEDSYHVSRVYEDTTKSVYDLELDGDSAFLSTDGIALHNTHFACTFPDPIYVLDTEFGTWPVAQKFDKEIHISNIPVLGEDDEPDAVASLKKFEAAIKEIGDDAETIVVDSGTDIWSWLGTWLEHVADKKTSNGRPYRMEWGKANEYYRNLWMLLTIKKTHLVFTGHFRQNYDSQGNPQDSWEPHWQKKTKHWLDVVLTIKKIPRKNQDPIYQTKMEKCRFQREFNPEVKDNTFESLVEKLEDMGVSVDTPQ